MSKMLNKNCGKPVFLEGPVPPGRPTMGPRWPQVGLKLGHDELGLAKMGIRWVKMGKISHKMKQDSAKMRKMVDLPRPKRAPRGLQGGPRGLQEGPKRAQEIPRGPKEGPKRPKMTPRWPKVTPDTRI